MATYPCTVSCLGHGIARLMPMYLRTLYLARLACCPNGSSVTHKRHFLAFLDISFVCSFEIWVIHKSAFVHYRLYLTAFHLLFFLYFARQYLRGFAAASVKVLFKCISFALNNHIGVLRGDRKSNCAGAFNLMLVETQRQRENVQMLRKQTKTSFN